MPGDRQGYEGNGGTIHRQQSNWVEEVTSPSGEASDLIEDALDQAEDLSANDLPSLSSSFSAIESHVTSLESAMDPRLRRQSGDGELGEAYGHQAYESLGPMLRQVQTASSALAERVQALHGRNGLPRDMLERSSRLESRVERAYLAHRARCPPQELERRLSRQASYPSVSSASASGVAATANTTNFNATTTATATNAAAAATATSPNTATTTTATTTTTGAAATATAVDTAATTVTAATGGESGGFTPTADRFEEVAGTTTPFARTLTLEELVMGSAEDEHQQNHEEEVKEAKEEEGKEEEKDGEEEQKLAEKRRRREAPEAPLVRGCGDGAAQLLGGAGVSENVSNCGSLGSSAQGAGMEACDEGGERACVDEGPIKPRNGDEEGDAQTMALDAARMAAEKRAVQVYSFGRGDLGTLLQSDDSDHSPEDGPVDLQENGSVIQVSTALFHTVAVMSSNHVIGCGQNDEGQIRPDLHQETFLPRPSLVGPFLSQRVTQVACGLYHTACVTTAGQAFSWGGNESGQLGHSPGVARAALPTAIEVEETGQAPFSKREVSMVTCGDLFTLILTSRAEVMTCGIGDCVGGDGTDRNKAALVQSLVGFPAVWMACGNSHSVVIGANGGVMAFGLNTHGQLGVGPMAEGEDRTVLQPRPVVGTFSRPITSSPASDKAGEGSTPRGSAPPASAAAAAAAAAAVGGDGGGGGGGGGVGGGGGGAQQVLVASFFAIRAACGQNHTILVSTDGHAWVCGRNRSGQLGLDPDEVPETSSPIRVPLFPLAGDSSGTGRASSRDGGGDGDSNGNGTGSGKENGNGFTATVAAAAAVTTAESAGMSYVVQAAAGRAHTLLLLSDGRLLGCGSNEFGALGVSPPPRTGPATAAIGAVGGDRGVSSGDGGSDDSGGRSGEACGAEVVGTAGGGGSGEAVADAGATHSWHWKPREIAGLTGRWVGSVSAGGEQSFAIVVRSEPSLPTPAHVPTPSLTPMPSSPTPSRSPADGLPAGLSTRPEEEVPSRATAAAAAEVEAGREPGCGEETMLDLFATLAGKSRFEAMRFRLPPRLTFETSESLLSRCGSVTVMAMLEKPGHRSRAGGLEGQGVGNRSWRLEETLVETVKKVFVSPSVLSGSFNLDPMVTGYTSVDKYGCNGPADATTATAATPAAPGWRGERGIPGLTRVDSAGLEAVYTKLVGMGPNMVSALWSAIEKGMETVTGAESGTAPSYSSLSASSPPPSSPPPLEDAGVSCLLKYWQGAAMLPVETPPDSDPNKGPKGRVMSRICMAVVALKAPALWRLMRSAKEDYPPALFSSRLVKPMVAHLGTCLPLHLDKGGGYSDTARLLKWLHSINELDPPPKIPYQDFFSEAISSITVESLLHDLYKWKNETPEGRKKRFYLSEQAFLMPTGAKKALLQAEAAVEQRKAAGASGVRFIPGVGLVLHPFLVLQINRDNLLQETLAQVSQVPDINLRKKLKVVFRGEEGVDEGGVTKEFFQLLTVQLFDQSFGMFVPAGVEGRSLWFNKDCVWAAEEYGLVGLLVGLAVYSGVILDVPLPLVVFKKVLGQQLTVDDLGDVDPDLLQGFQKLRDYAGGDDEDVFGIDFRVTWDDLGMQRTHDLKKNGANIPVTASNKNEYVERYANFLLVESVSHQFTHFKQGFMRVMSGASSISLLRAEELDVLVTGTPELDFDELAQATQYDGGYRGDHPTIKAFWAAVRDMPPEEQRRLLMFVTGSKKAPLGGLGKLSFKIQRAGPDTDHLPTSHTCFNVLMLPEYAGEEKLARLLKRAITECEGFGLK